MPMNWQKILGGVAVAGLLAGAQVASANDPAQATPPTPENPEQAGAAEQQQGSPSRVTVMQQDSALPADQQRTVTLTVTEVDRANNKVRFEAQVDPEAQLQDDAGQQLSINQLNPGDSVRASFDPATGEVQQMIVLEQGSSGQEPSTPSPSTPSTPSTPSPGSTPDSSSGY